MKKVAGGLLVVLSMTGCAAMRDREWGACTVAGAVIGGTVGGVTGGAAVNNADDDASDGERGGAIAGGIVGGAALGGLLGHLICDPLKVAAAPPPVAPPPPPPSQHFTLSTDALFDTAKWVIKPVGKAKIDEVVKAMKAKPDTKATVDGYCDFRGSDAYNQKLSERRAGAVVDYMVKGGISRSRLTARGHGEKDPVDPGKTPEALAKNRRVEIDVH